MIICNKHTFKTEVNGSDSLVVVDYYAEGCSICKRTNDYMENISQIYDGEVKFCKLDVSSARKFAIRQKIMKIPSIVFYRKGEKLAELIGPDIDRELILSVIQDVL